MPCSRVSMEFILMLGVVFETAMGRQKCKARLVLKTCDIPARACSL